MRTLTAPKLASAKWCARLGLVSLAVVVMAAIWHRLDVIQTPTLIGAIVVAHVTALAAVGFGLRAATRIWRLGYRGGFALLTGLVFAALTLAPGVSATYLRFTLPVLNDVSTDLDVPPAMHASAAGELAGGSKVFTPNMPDLTTQSKAYPDIVSGFYLEASDRMFAAALAAAVDLGWTITDRFPPAKPGEPGRFFAADRTLLFAFTDDIAVRILPTQSGSRVDLRSRSRIGRHDLGANAQRIRDFFHALDEALIAARLPR